MMALVLKMLFDVFHQVQFQKNRMARFRGNFKNANLEPKSSPIPNFGDNKNFP